MLSSETKGDNSFLFVLFIAASGFLSQEEDLKQNNVCSYWYKWKKKKELHLR